MKATNPEALNRDLPPTTWGKTLSATPVVMTIVATLLAGLASSEMTTAQYDRALGAQLQSKAGDQWSYFQAKKLRGAMQRSTLELLAATTDIPPLDLDALEKTSGVPRATIGTMARMIEKAEPPPDYPPEIKAALAAVAASRPESEFPALLKPITDARLAAALEAARDRARQFDGDMSSVTKDGLDEMEKHIAADKPLARAFAVTRLKLNAARYDAEARLNQAIANFLELQVRKANLSAEKHHARSGKFFIGMLAAQAAVIIATFAIAARKKNFLWSIAAGAGVLAVVFSLYVYLYV